ncbi:MAG: hypothetical protein GVY04_05450 [Cyanobacteria bacterium]|nr:hypothetical protein [Cyanobacteria bacterium GSL.Bin1]
MASISMIKDCLSAIDHLGKGYRTDQKKSLYWCLVAVPFRLVGWMQKSNCK